MKREVYRTNTTVVYSLRFQDERKKNIEILIETKGNVLVTW